MNMAERAEEVDYEPDVLKFKQIWNELKETNKAKGTAEKEQKTGGFEAPKSKKKATPKANEQTQPQPQTKQSKKQTVISEKNVVRNPKGDFDNVVEVVTKPSGVHVDSLKNQTNFIKREDYVQSANSPTLQGEV